MITTYNERSGLSVILSVEVALFVVLSVEVAWYI